MKIKKMLTPEQVSQNAFIQQERERLRSHVRLHLALADISIELMSTCFTLGLKDLKMPEVSVRVNTVLKGMESSGKRLRQLVSPIIAMKSEFEDQMQGDHAVEVYRLIKNLGLKNTEILRQFNDDFENQK